MQCPKSDAYLTSLENSNHWHGRKELCHHHLKAFTEQAAHHSGGLWNLHILVRKTMNRGKRGLNHVIKDMEWMHTKRGHCIAYHDSSRFALTTMKILGLMCLKMKQINLVNKSGLCLTSHTNTCTIWQYKFNTCTKLYELTIQTSRPHARMHKHTQ